MKFLFETTKKKKKTSPHNLGETGCWPARVHPTGERKVPGSLSESNSSLTWDQWPGQGEAEHILTVRRNKAWGCNEGR